MVKKEEKLNSEEQLNQGFSKMMEGMFEVASIVVVDILKEEAELKAKRTKEKVRKRKKKSKAKKTKKKKVKKRK